MLGVTYLSKHSIVIRVKELLVLLIVDVIQVLAEKLPII